MVWRRLGKGVKLGHPLHPQFRQTSSKRWETARNSHDFSIIDGFSRVVQSLVSGSMTIAFDALYQGIKDIELIYDL